MPVRIGESSPATTATMTSSSSAIPSVTCCCRINDQPWPSRANMARSRSPHRSAISSASDKGRVRGARVALEHDRQRGQEQEPAPFGAVLRRGLQHAPTAGDPAHCRGKLTPEEQSARLPKRAPRGAADLASAREPLVRAQPGGRAVVVVADQVGGKREPLQVLRLEGRVSLRRRHQGVGIGPRLPPQCLTPPLKGIGCGHRLSHAHNYTDVNSVRR